MNFFRLAQLQEFARTNDFVDCYGEELIPVVEAAEAVGKRVVSVECEKRSYRVKLRKGPSALVEVRQEQN